jgi:hypothetical protein
VHHHWQHSVVRSACSRSKLPIAPKGNSRFACCLQWGGGVYVYSGTVAITSSSIHRNSAGYVRAHAQNFPSPRWEDCYRACFDSRLHNCGADAPVNYSMYVPQIPAISHRPDGRPTCCLLFAGRWCLGHGWHSDHLVEQHQWEHSSKCASSFSQRFPSPRWETHV